MDDTARRVEVHVDCTTTRTDAEAVILGFWAQKTKLLRHTR